MLHSSKTEGEEPKTRSSMPRHASRALEIVESVLRFREAIPVGHIVEAVIDSGERIAGEVMNVERLDSEFIYYIHFLGKSKCDDAWVLQRNLEYITDYSRLRGLADPPIALEGPWSGFFQLSQLSKQVTAGSSVYGSSSSSSHHDPHEFSPKTIAGVDFGGSLRIKSWFRSPYPREVWSMKSYLHVCPRCLVYGSSSPPDHECSDSLSGGQLVYSKGKVAVYELDGLDQWDFCERLFLLAKLFLEDKRTSGEESSQTSQVTPFLFYVLMERDARGGERFVGYFSKYKIHKKDGPILSCILVLPSEQRKGYGKLLISIAYELSKREGRLGSAERPLSGPGLAAFLSWWTWRLKLVLEKCYDGEVLSLAQLSELSGMTSEDVVETLRHCGAVKQWGGSSSAAGGDVKLRESGKRAKIKLTMETYRALERRSPKGRNDTVNDFEPDCLSGTTRICQILQTPRK